MGSAHGGNSTRRPCVGQRISRGQCCSQTVLPQTRTSRQRRGARVCTIRPRRPHCGHRHPVLWGFTAITRSPLPRPSNQKSTARNPLNFNSFDTNLTAVIGRSPCPLRDGLMSSNTKPRERPMALSCTQRFGVGKTGLSLFFLTEVVVSYHLGIVVPYTWPRSLSLARAPEHPFSALRRAFSPVPVRSFDSRRRRALPHADTRRPDRTGSSLCHGILPDAAVHSQSHRHALRPPRSP